MLHILTGIALMVFDQYGRLPISIYCSVLGSSVIWLILRSVSNEIHSPGRPNLSFQITWPKPCECYVFQVPKLFFSDNEKKGVFEYGKSKYIIYFLIGPFLLHILGIFCRSNKANIMQNCKPRHKNVLSSHPCRVCPKIQSLAQESGKPNV